ncbi:MAG: hypothetical protein MZV63_64575 [Marinilabiliales bacterium]|nr:hypothetical protein [Marinilabiliales bacterium]
MAAAVDRDRDGGRRPDGQGAGSGGQRRPGLDLRARPVDAHASRVLERVGLARGRERPADRPRRCEAAGRCDRESARRRHRQGDGAGRVPGPVGRVRKRHRVRVGPGGQRVGRGIDRDRDRGRGAGGQGPRRGGQRRPGLAVRAGPVDGRTPGVLERIGLARRRERTAGDARRGEATGRRDRENARSRNGQGDGAGRVPRPVGRVGDRQRVGVGPGGQRVGQVVDQDVHRHGGPGGQRSRDHVKRRPGLRLRGRPVDARASRVLERVRLARGREGPSDRPGRREPASRRHGESPAVVMVRETARVAFPVPLVVLVKVTVSV